MSQDPVFVKRAFGAIADRYVLTNHVLSGGVDVLWRRRVARLVREKAPEAFETGGNGKLVRRRILDLATGSGDLAAEILRTVPDAEVIGADFCAPMLTHARKRGLKQLVVADGMRLPFNSGTFDAVTVAYGLRNMASWPDALWEMRRVLRPGGLLAVLDFSIPTREPLRTPYRWYLHRVLPAVAGWLTGQKEAYTYLSDSIERFPSGEAMLSLLRDCGYEAPEWIPLWGGISSVYLGRQVEAA